jgi:nucleotide-binding universal stress UspA family protein
MSVATMILICYDGSPDSRSAIEHAGELMEGHPATVLTVWEPFVDVLARTPSGFGLAPGMVNVDEIDDASYQSALEQAREGAELATQSGLNAQPRTRALHTTISSAILAEADEIDAGAIVMGSRGLTGLKSLLMGSVSHAVLQHADRTVMVVPSPTVAEARHQNVRIERAEHAGQH